MDGDRMYTNIFDFYDPRYPVQILYGSRGMGKTYSALRGVALKKDTGDLDPGTIKKFIYMRRTQSQIDYICDRKGADSLNPFKPINRDYGVNIGIKKESRNVAMAYNRSLDDNGNPVYCGDSLGYILGLTGVASVRGIDASDASDWIYDEFIKERHENILRGECEALLNAYETFNRNRESTGNHPLRLWMLSNSNDIYNPIFQGLNIVNDIEKMENQGKHDIYYKDRGLAVHALSPTEEFITFKKHSALGRLAEGTAFASMAIDNKFAFNDFSLIKYLPVSGGESIVNIDNFTIYKLAGSQGWYCSYAYHKAPIALNTKLSHDVIRFKRNFGGRIQDLFPKRKITFESYEIKCKILELTYGNYV